MAGPFKPVGVDADNLFPARVETRLTETIRDTIGSTLVAGANTTITVDDAGNKVTIASTGGSAPAAATTSAAGVVKFATLAQTQAGTDPTLVPSVVTMRQTVQGYHLDDFSEPLSDLDLGGMRTQNMADPINTQDGATKGWTTTTFAPRNSGLVYGEDGKKYAIVAGVLRNSGTGWAALSDSEHRPVNVGAVTQTTDSIVVSYSALNVARIASFVVTPDETFAAAGFAAGASVDVDQARIQISRTMPVADYVSYNGSAWVSANGVFSPSFSAGVLTLTHPSIGSTAGGGNDVALTGRGGAYVPVVSNASGAAAETTLKVEFRDWAGTLVMTPDVNMKVFVSHGNVGVQNPADVSTAVYPFSNLWFYGLFELV